MNLYQEETNASAHAEGDEEVLDILPGEEDMTLDSEEEVGQDLEVGGLQGAMVQGDLRQILDRKKVEKTVAMGPMGRERQRKRGAKAKRVEDVRRLWAGEVMAEGLAEEKEERMRRRAEMEERGVRRRELREAERRSWAEEVDWD